MFFVWFSTDCKLQYTVIPTSVQVVTKYLPGSFFGEDRKGRPVFYDFMGNLDVKGTQ